VTSAVLIAKPIIDNTAKSTSKAATV